MAKIYFLGTSASVSTKERDNTSLLILYSKRPILVDIGGSPLKKLQTLNIKFYNLKDVIITHTHPDHIYGLVSLVHSQGYFNDFLNIYTHSLSINFIKKYLKLFKVFNKKPYPHIRFVAVDKTEPFYSYKNLKIFYFKTKHISNSFGIKIIKNEKKIIFTSDTRFFKELTRIAKGSDFLICDCTAPHTYFLRYRNLFSMHTSSLQLGILAKECGVKNLVPIHFLVSSKKHLEKMKKEIKKNFKGNVIFPKDFSFIEF